MNEISLQNRDAAPATWAELKVELHEAAILLAALWLRADAEARAEVQTLAASGNSILAQLLTIHVGRPPASG